jgi:hypothetical protein
MQHEFKAGALTGLRRATALLAAVILGSCGGGGGGTTIVPTDASPGGIWSGTDSLSGLAVTGLVTEAGEFHVIRSDNVQFFGTLNVSRNSVSGNFTGVTPVGFVFPDGSATGTGTISGTVQERVSASLATSFRTSRGTTSASNLLLTFNALYNRASSLATIAGNYLDPVTNAVINVNSNGVVFAQGAVATGCIITGTISVINAMFNAYRVQYTFSSCGTPYAILNGPTANGLGTLDNTVNPERAIIGVVNATAGYAYAGAFPRT